MSGADWWCKGLAKHGSSYECFTASCLQNLPLCTFFFYLCGLSVCLSVLQFLQLFWFLQFMQYTACNLNSAIDTTICRPQKLQFLWFLQFLQFLQFGLLPLLTCCFSRFLNVLQIAADLTFITSYVGVMNGADWWCDGLAKHGSSFEDSYQSYKWNHLFCGDCWFNSYSRISQCSIIW